MIQEEGELVGTGSFLVDRSQALDKLMRFQLPNPAGFALLWLRCAAAGGASYFTVNLEASALRIYFDGRPFKREELVDPYRCLFEKRAKESERNRLLAIGLLSALRLGPSPLRLSSGEKPRRFSLRLLSLEKEKFEETPDEHEDTAIELEWTRAGVTGEAAQRAARREAIELLRAGCALSTLQITIDAEPLPGWRNGAAERVLFEDGASRGWVAVPEEPVTESVIDLYSHGARVETLSMKLPIAQVRAALNDDGFSLNASQSGVVRDERFRSAIKRLEEPVRRLVIAQAAELGHGLAKTALALADGAYRLRWRDTLELGQAAESEGGLRAIVDQVGSLLLRLPGAPGQGTALVVEARARAVRWLRRLCAQHLRGRPKEGQDAFKLALWRAPLFVSSDCAPRSLEELASENQSLAYLPFSNNHSVGLSLPFRPLWAIAAGEEALAARLLGWLPRDVTPTVDRLRRVGHELDRAASFERAGLPPPLIRAPLELGKVSGEVGLSSVPEPRGRLHLLTEGLPSGVIEDSGALRFDAVASDPERRWELHPLTKAEKPLCDELLEQARGKAIGLYRKLSQEFEPSDASARGAAIRAHLLDFLQVAASGGPRFAEEPWIAELPLFESQAGSMSYETLAASLERREPVYAARQWQEHAWQSGKFLIAGADLNAELLGRLLPDCELLPIRGRPGVFAIVKRLAAPCREPSPLRCCFAVRLYGKSFHVASNEKKFSWDELSLHEAPSGDEPALDLAGQDEFAVELMSALLRQFGTLLDKPDDPFRRFLLALLAEAPPPWAGGSGKSLWKALGGKPFFRSPGNAGRTLEDAYAVLHDAHGQLTYAPQDAPGLAADLILDERELAALRRLEPLGAGRLRPHGAPVRDRRRPAAEEEAAEPAESSFLSIFRGKRLINPRHRFFLERRYQSDGLDVWLGLPTRLPTPKPAFVPGGDAEFELAMLPPLAYVLIDAAAWPKTAAPAPMPVLMSLLKRFYEDISQRWPIAKPRSEHFPVAQRYILEAALHSGRAPKLFHGWEPLRRRLFNLKIFQLNDRSWASLDELRDEAAATKQLRYIDPIEEQLDPAQGVAPILRYPRLVSEILGGLKPRRVRHVQPKPAPTAESAPAPQAPPLSLDPEPEATAPAREHAGADIDHPALAYAHKLLLGLRGRKGLRLARQELGRLGLGRGLPLSPLTIDQDGGWVLDAEHPMVAAILKSSLPAEEQAAFLASIAYTAANRLKEQITDEDDIRFQEALSSAL